jgi:hypothetical protein
VGQELHFKPVFIYEIPVFALEIRHFILRATEKVFTGRG